MNDRQRRFVEEYLVDLNATAAYRRAGYKAKGNAAEVNAARLLRNAQVQSAIAEAKARRSKRTEITADYVLQGIQEIAERCLQRAPVMEGRGEDRRQAVDEHGNHVWAFDASGGNKAFELLGKHLKLFTEKVDLSSPDGTMSPPSLAQFYGAMAKASGTE